MPVPRGMRRVSRVAWADWHMAPMHASCTRSCHCCLLPLLLPLLLHQVQLPLLLPLLLLLPVNSHVLLVLGLVGLAAGQQLLQGAAVLERLRAARGSSSRRTLPYIMVVYSR